MKSTKEQVVCIRSHIFSFKVGKIYDVEYIDDKFFIHADERLTFSGVKLAFEKVQKEINYEIY